MSELKSSVVCTRLRKSREAGRELANKTLLKLGTTPNFIILITTIHYKKLGGFNEFLAGIYDVFPKTVRLVGATAAGFITPEGCFTFGATLVGVRCDEMHFSCAVAEHMRRNPKLAGHKLGVKIRRELDGSSYPHAFAIHISSGPKAYNLPGLKLQRIIRTENHTINKIMSTLTSLSLNISGRFLGLGIPFFEDAMGEIYKELCDYSAVGFGSIDDNSLIYNYQFLDNKVFTDSIVLLGVKSNYNFNISTSFGFKKTDKILDVTSVGLGGAEIKTIEGHPAMPWMAEKFGWGKWFFDDVKFYRRSLFTPFMSSYVCPITKQVINYIQVLGWVFGDSIILGIKCVDGKLNLLSASGKSIIDSVDKSVDNISGLDSRLGFIISCSARLETLGPHVYDVYDRLVKHFGSTPFVVVYAGGEDAYTSETGMYHGYESFHVGVLNKP